MLKLLSLLWVIAIFALSVQGEDGEPQTCDNLSTDEDGSYTTMQARECTLVMAKSNIPNSGWGVFSLIPRKRGSLIHDGDPVVQIPDLNPHWANGARRLIFEYLWDGQETFGQYEGQKVMSFSPGIGMLANGHATQHNVLPYKPILDSSDLLRKESPGAGASTTYQNYTWFMDKDAEAGEELYVNYGPGWFQERGFVDQPRPSNQQSLSDLQKDGYCLDNIVSGRSTIKYAGRGAFASRNIGEGWIVAPFSLLPVSSSTLLLMKQHESGSILTQQQLLQNYCFGHQNSSVLLLPYSPMVNLINHSNGKANVELQWAESSLPLLSKPSTILQESSSHLLMELIATRPIQKGEEIILDYGREWNTAWENHVKQWEPNTEDYQGSQTMNNIIGILRTAKELRERPYPENILTSCFYRYPGSTSTSTEIMVDAWKYANGLYQSPNLRPCSVLEREEDSEGNILYTVQLLNRPGLAANQRIPRGQAYIVKNVPRQAITFSDKLYTTDQHLANAFRKEMGLGDLFPSQWMDIK